MKEKDIRDSLVVWFDKSKRGALRKAAHVDTSLNVEVSLVTPGLAPRVFDGPEVSSSFIGSESNSKNGMVNILIQFYFGNKPKLTFGCIFAGGRRVGAVLVVHKIVHNFKGDRDRLVHDHRFRHF